MVASLELQKAFGLDQVQADAIIDMKLGRLSHLETDKLLQELADLEVKIAYYNELLADRNKILGVVKDELTKIGEAYGDRRRTVINERELEDATPEDFIKKEEVVVSITGKGFAKRIPSEEYKAQNRGGKGTIGARLVDSDIVKHFFICSSHDILLFVTNKGKAYYIKAFEIPEAAKTAKGINLKTILQVENDEKITAVINFREFCENDYILMGTKYGVTKKVMLNDFINAKARGVKAIILDEDDELTKAIFVEEDDEVLYITKLGKCLRTSARSVRTMGRSTHGVRGIKLADGDELVSVVKVEEDKTVLLITEQGKGKRVLFSEFMAHGRGTGGQKIYTIEQGETGIVDAFAVSDDDDVLFITKKGQAIRVHCSGISIQGRAARGVKVAEFKKANDHINAMAVTGYSEEPDEVEFVEGDDVESDDDPAENK